MYISWMLHATLCGIAVWFILWASYGHFNTMGDNGLFALGDLAFTLGILWTNWKIFMIETHYKTVIVGVGFGVTIGGWFAWNGFMSAVYMNNTSPYDVNGGFSSTFGRDPNWWLTMLVAFSVLATAELVFLATKRVLVREGLWRWWGRDEGDVGVGPLEIWQEMEKDEGVRRRLERMARGEDEEDES